MSDENKRLGVAIGGAAIGAYFGVPGVGFAVGTLAGGLLFPGKDPDPILGPQLDELLQQTSTYGRFIPYIVGAYRVAGNVFWSAPIKEVANKESSGGGKGGTPQQDSITFSYFWTTAISLSEGPIAGIRKVWVNDEFYTDMTNPTANSPFNARVYRGTETQVPDATIEAFEGVGRVPAHRGEAYVVLEDLPLAFFNNTPPVFHFEVVVDGVADVQVDLIADTGEGTRGIAVDPESGLVWMARGVLGNEVRIFSVDQGFSLVRAIAHDSAAGMAWCPGFVSVRSSLAGPQITTNPPRMWVSSGSPDFSTGSNLVGYKTDGSYKADIGINPFGGSLFCWPGAVIVDKSSVLTRLPNMDGVTVGLVGVTNGACGGIRAFQLDSVLPKTSKTFVGYNTFGGRYVADWVEGGQDTIYSIDFVGRVYKLVKGTPFDVDPPGEFILAEYFVNDTADATEGTGSGLDPSNGVTYDPDEQTVYTRSSTTTGSQVVIRKFDSNLNLIWSVLYNGFGTFLPEHVRYHEGIGDIWLFGRETVDAVTLNHAKRIDKTDGSIIEDLTTDWAQQSGNFRPYPNNTFAVATGPFNCAKIPLVPGATPGPPTLREVITRFCLLTKRLTTADIDVTGIPITDIVEGYAIAARMPTRNALEPLLKAYFVDVVEIDGKLTFVKRGNTSIVTIPTEDLAVHPVKAVPPAPLTSSRTQDDELPRGLDVRFTNRDDDYKIGVAIARRLTGGSHQVRTENISIVFSPDQAKQIAETLLYTLWSDRNPQDFVVSRKYLKYTPSDVITVEHPQLGNVDLRINKVSYHFPQLMKIQGIPEDPTIYSDFIFPAPETLAIQPTFTGFANMVMFVLDIPLLRDVDNNAGLYVGAYSLSGTFTAGDIYRSEDALSYTHVVGLTEEASVGTVEADSTLTWTGSFK